VLRRELSPTPVAIRMTSGTANWPPDMCGMVAALVTIWPSASRLKYCNRHDIDDGTQADDRRPDASAEG
jgi:hypothetical protein